MQISNSNTHKYGLAEYAKRMNVIRNLPDHGRQTHGTGRGISRGRIRKRRNIIKKTRKKQLSTNNNNNMNINHRDNLNN